MILSYYQKRINKSLKEKHLKTVEGIKQNWKLITIDTTDCKVIKFDKEIHLNSLNKEKFSFWERFNNDSTFYQPKK